MRLPVAFAAALAVAAPAAADVTRGELPTGKKVMLDNAYRKNNQIRIFAQSSRNTFPTEVMRAAVVHMAEMTQAKSLPRFAVVKISDCGQMRMYGVAVNSQCRLIGQMLAEGETARPEGKYEMTYFRVSDVLGGNLRPEGGTPTGF